MICAIHRRISKKNPSFSYLALCIDNYCVSIEPRVLCAVSKLPWDVLKDIKVGEPLVLAGKE